MDGATVPASALRAGVNVVAVEIHRAPGAAFMYRERVGSRWSRCGFDGLTLSAPSGSGVAVSGGRPRGLQVAGVFQEYFGLFTRMPTDTPIKGRMLIDLARLMLASEEEESDEEEAELLRALDVAEAEDRRALLLSYVLSPAQIEQIIE